MISSIRYLFSSLFIASLAVSVFVQQPVQAASEPHSSLPSVEMVLNITASIFEAGAFLWGSYLLLTAVAGGRRALRNLVGGEGRARVFSKLGRNISYGSLMILAGLAAPGLVDRLLATLYAGP